MRLYIQCFLILPESTWNSAKQAKVWFTCDGFFFLSIMTLDLKLRVYGSSLTGFGLKQSNLNMDLVLPEGMNLAKGLSEVYRTLKQSGKFSLFLILLSLYPLSFLMPVMWESSQCLQKNILQSAGKRTPGKYG